jgi:hypothetical protein
MYSLSNLGSGDKPEGLTDVYESVHVEMTRKRGEGEEQAYLSSIRASGWTESIGHITS